MYHTKFKVGDRVRFNDGVQLWDGIISKIIQERDTWYPICVKFDTDNREQWFTPDGSIDYNDEVVIFKIEECYMDKIKFQVGDEVSWDGMLCTVVDMVGGSHPVMIANLDGNRIASASFTLDGKFHISMTEPSLKLVKRAKQKVKPMPALISIWGRKRLEISEEVFNTLEDAKEFYREFEFTLNSKDQQQKALIAWPYIPGVTEIEE